VNLSSKRVWHGAKIREHLWDHHMCRSILTPWAQMVTAVCKSYHCMQTRREVAIYLPVWLTNATSLGDFNRINRQVWYQYFLGATTTTTETYLSQICIISNEKQQFFMLCTCSSFLDISQLLSSYSQSEVTCFAILWTTANVWRQNFQTAQTNFHFYLFIILKGNLTIIYYII